MKREISILLMVLSCIFACHIFSYAEIGKSLVELENSEWVSYINKFGIQKSFRKIVNEKSFSINSTFLGLLTDSIIDNNDKIKEHDFIICLKMNTPGMKNALIDLVPKFIKEATGSQIEESQFMPLVNEGIKKGELKSIVKDFIFTIKYAQVDTRVSKTEQEQSEILGIFIKKCQNASNSIPVDKQEKVKTPAEYFKSGLIYVKQGNFNQAVSDFTKAIVLNPNYAEAYCNRGTAYAKQGNFNQAISDHTKAIALNPDFAEAYCNRGIAYSSQGNFSQAIPDFTKAIALNPNLTEAYYIRGLTYYKQGIFSQAILDFTEAIAINSNHVEAYCNRGDAYSSLGNFSQAISDYNKGIEINPNYAEAYCNRGIIYYLTKEYDKAWIDVHKAIELGYVVKPEFIAVLKKDSGRDN